MLYSHLRDSHVRSLSGYSGRGMELAEEADRELQRRIIRVIKDAKKSPWEYIPSAPDEFERDMSVVFGDGSSQTDGGVSITALVKYVLAREGYDPRTLEVVQTEGEAAYDEFGVVKLNALMEINEQRERVTGMSLIL